jgi:PEP-CTERM motif
MFKRILSVTLLSFALSASAQAQSDLTVTSSVPLGGRSVVSFTVTTAGIFDLWTTSASGASGTTPFDPQMQLFAGLPSAGGYVGGANLAGSDDGCGTAEPPFYLAQCGPAIFASNALIDNFFLGTGDYTVVVNACCTNIPEIRSGVGLPNGTNGSTGDYNLRIASLQVYGGGTGVANLTGTVVPEPSTYLLTAAGLVGLGFVARRRRQR